MGMNRFNRKETDEEFISRALLEEVSYSESIHLISWNYRKSYSDVFWQAYWYGLVIIVSLGFLAVFVALFPLIYFIITLDYDTHLVLMDVGNYIFSVVDPYAKYFSLYFVSFILIYILFGVTKLFFFTKSSSFDFFWHRGEVKVFFKIFDYKGRLERRVIPLKEINELIVVGSRWRGDSAETRGLLVKSNRDDIIIMYYTTWTVEESLRRYEIIFNEVLLRQKDYYTQLLRPVDDIETTLDGEYM